MNRGNLAEDPRAGLSSSSRYSRDGGEKNSLLYVDSSSLRKEKKAAARRDGNRGSAIKGNQNSRRKGSVGRGLTDSHMDRLEVGSDGRLFQVKELSSPSTSENKTHSDKTAAVPAAASLPSATEHLQKNESAQASGIRPAIIAGGITAAENASATEQSSDSLRTKPERSYLTQPNPLLKKRNNAQRKSDRKTESKAEQKTESKAEQKTESKTEQKAQQESQVNSDREEEKNTVVEAEQSSVVSEGSENAQSRPEEHAKAQAAAGSDEPAASVEAPQTKEAGASSDGMLRREYKSLQNPLLAAGKPEAARENSTSDKTSSRSLLYRLRVPLIASALALATAGYTYAAWHYSNRFYPGTEFFGIPAAEQSVYDVKAAVKAKVDSYSLQLVARKPNAESTVRDESSFASDNVIAAEDVGMVYRDNGEIDKAMKEQKSWAWPFMMLAQLFGTRESALETSYDRSLIPEAVGSLACMQKDNIIKPQNAQIVLTDDGAQVQTEIYGTQLKVRKTQEAVENALNSGSTMIDLDDLGLYVNPRVNSSDLSLTAEAMAMNKVLGAKILLRFGNQTEVINSEVIVSFLDKEYNSYILNEEKVRNYVSKLAKKYDTYQCERDFYTSIGTKVTLEAGIGDYGWELDQDATYEKIIEAIRGQKKTTIEPVYTQEAYCRDSNDIGNTYVEISLTNQKMWFYRNGNLIVETPIVTGNPYSGHETPSGGVWSLKGKARNQTLSGQGYTAPVDYWMPFFNGVGIHDMQSRYWFGGTIYLGSGSHGCVNTPLPAVRLIYDQIEEGVPIIVYKDESDQALSLVTDPVDIQTLTTQIEENFGTVEDDGIGSIVAWSRSQAAQAQAAQAAAAQTAATAGGTSAS